MQTKKYFRLLSALLATSVWAAPAFAQLDITVPGSGGYWSSTDLTNMETILDGLSYNSGSITLSGTVQGATVTATSSLDSSGTLTVSTTSSLGGVTTITDATASTAATNGALIVSGGIGVAGNSNFGGTLDIDGNTTITTGTFDVSSGATTLGSTLDVTGNTNFNSTTASSSSTTGAVIIDGGLGVAEDIYVGANVNVTGTADIGGITTITDATAATSSADGALVVTGGAGIGGNSFFGGTLGVTGATTLTSTSLSIGGVSYTWPGADGAADEVLQTNGAGTLSWGTLTGAEAGSVAAGESAATDCDEASEAGDVVYDQTDLIFYGCNGSAWQALTNVPS